MTTLDLFPRPPRALPRKLMHVVDAGHCDNGVLVHFRCKRCGHDAGWFTVANVTEGKRGIPCPRCSESTS
jgi:hypothetical protein